MNDIIAIRGAVTAFNTVESITRASVRLMDRIYFKNGLTNADIVNISITTTSDITAFYPARAIREAGYTVPLFSALEPNIDGGLGGCIRVMVTARSDRPPYNVYLNGARKLRPDVFSRFAVALDGPSGAGKSTVAKLVSKKLEIAYLDTGALYRTLGLKAVGDNVDTKDPAAVEACLKDAEVGIEFDGGMQRMLLNGKDVTAKIRTPEISMAASAVSAVPYVREKLLGLQRNIAEKHSVILDGRDIGTVVLPNAEFKYYLTASAETRARRRMDELTARGEKTDFASVLAGVNTRDKNDSTRAIAPLKKAFDAVEINSDGLSAEEVADIIITAIRGDIA